RSTRSEKRGRLGPERDSDPVERVHARPPALLDLPNRAERQTGILGELFLSQTCRPAVGADGLSQRTEVVRHTGASVLTSTLKTVPATTPRDCPKHTGRCRVGMSAHPRTVMP